MVSALHRTFSRLKRRINARISWRMVGRPPFRRDFQIACQPNSRDSSTDRRKSFKVFMPQDSRRRAGITTFAKLSETKGYEVFRVDKMASRSRSTYRGASSQGNA